MGYRETTFSVSLKERKGGRGGERKTTRRMYMLSRHHLGNDLFLGRFPTNEREGEGGGVVSQRMKALFLFSLKNIGSCKANETPNAKCAIFSHTIGMGSFSVRWIILGWAHS